MQVTLCWHFGKKKLKNRQTKQAGNEKFAQGQISEAAQEHI
jgi:hypothetical protein